VIEEVSIDDPVFHSIQKQREELERLSKPNWFSKHIINHHFKLLIFTLIFYFLLGFCFVYFSVYELSDNNYRDYFIVEDIRTRFYDEELL